MITRLLHLAAKIRSSLWFVPACMSLGAALLALGAARLDAVLAEQGQLPFFLYAGDKAGARDILSTVASSMIGIAGVTFSVIVVALSLASSQFGPRLLVSFMRDVGNQLVLGTFIATFLFCLIALGSGGGVEDPSRVPVASTTLAVLLAVLSLGFFIYFIHHASASMQAESVIDAVACELREALARMLPDEGVEDPEQEQEESESQQRLEKCAELAAPRDGYIQRTDEASLIALAKQEDLRFTAPHRPGHFVAEGETLVSVAGCEELPDALARRIRGCFILGSQRTHEQDPEYGINQLVEIASRALSPGINDPHTAVACVDWLGAALAGVAGRRLRSARRRDAEGRLRLVTDALTFDGLLAAAFNQIRQDAARVPSVSIRILEALGRIGARAQEPRRRAAVRAQAEMTLHGALAEDPAACDRDDLEARHREVIGILERG